MSDAATRSPADLVEQGRALHREGRLDEAERLYAQALAADEEYAEAHQLMAVIAGQRGRFDEAIAGFRRTIALDGPTPERLFNLAEAYRVSGQFDPAVAAYNHVLTLDAAFFDAYQNCAEMAKEASARATSSGNTALAERLKVLAAHYLLGLGNARLRGANEAAAEKAYREAIALDPASADAYNSLGMIALVQHRPIEAETLLRTARALDQKSALFLSNLGLVLLDQVRMDEAAASFRGALEIDASFEQARTNLEERMLPSLHYRADLEAAAIFSAHRDWGRTAVAHAETIFAPSLAFPNPRNPDRPITVAYLGLDTSSRLAHCLFEPLVANHDQRAITTIIYATSGGDASGILHFRKLASSVQPLSLRRAQEAVPMIRKQRVDILIDIAGHSHHNRLDIFACKPAPVAVTWLGYPDTTGLSTVDYRVTDDAADPPGAEELHTERLYRLRAGSLVYRPPPDAPEVAVRQATAPGAITFGNLDDPRKIAPEVMRTWGSILSALPQARLLLQSAEYADTGFVERMRREFGKSGIDLERVAMRPTPTDAQEQLRTYAEVDIGLDTFPYNNDSVTTCEALWMGVPVVTLSGDRSCGRRTASILAQVGLERLMAHKAEEYAAAAVDLAQDPDRLSTLRTGMRDRLRVSPLMDERGFARAFEAALRHMWRDWCNRSRESAGERGAGTP